MEYVAGVLVLGVGRAMDLVTTRMATPDLAMEVNKFAVRLGWKGMIVFNLIMVFLIPFLGLEFAIGAAIMSLLAAINNSRVTEMLYLFENRQALQAASARSHKTLPLLMSLKPVAYESLAYLLIGAWMWWTTGVPYYGAAFIFIGLYVGWIRMIWVISNWEPPVTEKDPTPSI